MNLAWAKISAVTKAISIAAFAVLLMSFTHGSQASQFYFGQDVVGDDAPVSRVEKPSRTIKASRAASRPRTVVEDSDDAPQRTHGKICVECDLRAEQAKRQARIPIKKMARVDQTDGYNSAQEKCYGEEIFKAAKARTARAYHNRPRSPGTCAVGVRLHLGAAGVYDGRPLGNGAIDYSSSGKLRALGFENRLSQYPTPESAPKGAVLIFAGAGSSNYMINRVKAKCSGPAGHRVCSGNGNWAGHITIAGEKVGKGRWYYTDARTAQPAIRWPQDQQTRRLVGVYVMKKCGPDCSPALRARCGG